MKKVREIMTADVLTVNGNASVAEAVALMNSRRVRALVVEARGEDDAYGIVTETDVVYKVCAYDKDPATVKVHEIMTKPCVVVNPDLGVKYCARLFANVGIRRAPVIQQKLLGIVTVTDILRKGM
ncbi:MAG: CBS domain-containing protein [Lentisphaeria bacterium]|nr:CBS domain-containing protein [Lentisphaeria bacterium]